MYCTLLLIVGLPLSSSQPLDEISRAIAVVKKADGKLFFDEKSPGRPVVGVNL
jgi:hypothetical protein